MLDQIGRGGLRVYLGAMVGSALFLYDGRNDFGWRVGLLAGGQLFVTRVLGILGEVGFVRDSATVNDSDFSDFRDITYDQVQAVINVGRALVTPPTERGDPAAGARW